MYVVLKQTRNCAEYDPPFLSGGPVPSFWPVLLLIAHSLDDVTLTKHLYGFSPELRNVTFSPYDQPWQLFPILTWSLQWVMFTEQAAHISDTRKGYLVQKKIALRKKNIFHSHIFRSGLRHCQRNSLRHNKVLWQGTALWNCPCLMFSSVGFAVELQFCSYLCHIEVHRHTDCYLWEKSYFGPRSNKVTILRLSAKWWRVRSQAAV